AEPVSIELLPGLTGIVGPNGCGKSNVVEALRFVMGESSARSMRSGEMDDVIFSGTAARPARNLAEVALTVEAGDAPLPVPFHEAAELVISRSVERGRGSTFRINGREVRARDAQTFFADLGSGSRASAMITQGRITALVAARPEERRVVLEEAAGITGLYARRHEAELKLAAAEANLARADELKAELETGLAALRRQARQASRYRNLGGAIRAAEAELLAIARREAVRTMDAAGAALQAARLALAEATVAAEAAASAATEAAAALPGNRAVEAASRTALERARLRREQIAAEEARARAELAAAARHLAELDRDLAHAAGLAADADAALARLGAEAGTIASALERDAAGMQSRQSRAEAAEAAAEAAQAATERAAEVTAGLLARAAVLERERKRLEERAKRLAHDEARLAADQARLAAAADHSKHLAAAAREEEAADAALRETQSLRETREAEREAAAATHREARDALAAADAEANRLSAEIEALAALIAAARGESSAEPALADTLDVPSGLEAALAAALGEALDADPARWRALPPLAALPSLPGSATPLQTLIPPPPALARALSMIGLIENADDAGDLQPALSPGQVLVSREGGVWRWDGYAAPPARERVTAIRMAARNKLALLRDRHQDAAPVAATARAGRDAAAAAEQAAIQAVHDAVVAHRGAEQRAQGLRRAGDALRRDAAALAGETAALARHAERIGSERTELGEALLRLESDQATVSDTARARADLDVARAALARARAGEAAARAEQAAMAERSAALSARQSAIAGERGDWADRSAAAARQARELSGRRETLAAGYAALAAEPAELASRAALAITLLDGAEETHRDAARMLAESEENAETATRKLRLAERAAASAREQMLLGEASVREREAALAALDERVRERLGADARLPEVAGDADAEPLARQRLERLIREREAMGPVNLRAEIEAQEIEGRISAIVREGEELVSAIAKLRGSIGHLNREGRTRLSAMFTEVDRHFQALFKRMFGGGRAHLALVGADDPLAAGLEIYAEPPGKKLSLLSLLSGGEQALIALSLVFAVFRCNPAPIAVLDEVDAPLDDVNVGRFCALIEEIVRECGTRILIATHHPLTMARMDRLYGVTMQERGISRLLSVDLAAATEMADPPRMAAE
ncbi:MAG: chromosome segregation SMC family protein, partial [Acetobacteraceae bacterium]